MINCKLINSLSVLADGTTIEIGQQIRIIKIRKTGLNLLIAINFSKIKNFRVGLCS
jgi:hypothetical protein